MLTMFVRAVFLYLFVVVVMRGLGKRQIAQLQPYELTATILMADLAAAPMQDVGIPLVYGVMPIAAMVICHCVLSLLTLKSTRARELISGKPSILVRNGVVDENEMKRQGFSLALLMEEVRADGIHTLAEVGVAILEVSGDLSVFPISQMRPVTTRDLSIATGYDGHTLTLVLDGRVMTEALRSAGRDEAWLRGQIGALGYSPGRLLLCTLSTEGILHCQPRGEQRLYVRQAMPAEEVSW